VIIWFSGLSGAGKSTTIRKLIKLIPGCVVLDGTALADVPQEPKSIAIALTAKRFVPSGRTIVCACANTLQVEMETIRGMFEDGQFIEVYVGYADIALSREQTPEENARKVKQYYEDTKLREVL
jgi:adenylylsulfate kinase-like enzyme